MTRPDISVVIPTHNRKHEVRAALRSVAAQDIGDFSIEVIVVFDQEAPDPNLVREFADLLLRVLENQRAPGLAGARNTGATHANGAFLAWLDDDDRWLPGKLAAQLRLFQEHDTVGVATTGVVLRHETGPLTSRADRSPSSRRNPAAAPQPAAVLDWSPRLSARPLSRPVSEPDLTFLGLIRERSTFATHPSSIMVRREAFDAIGPVDENIPGSYGEDYDWLLRAARVTEIGYLPTPFVEVSWGQQSHYSEKWPTQARSWSYMLAKYPEFRDVPRASARVLAQRGLAHVGSGERTKARSDLRQATRQAVRCPGAARVWARILLGWLAYLGLVEPSSLLHRLRRHGRGF